MKMKTAYVSVLVLVFGLLPQLWSRPFIDPALKAELLHRHSGVLTVIAKFRKRGTASLSPMADIQSQQMTITLASQREFMREMGMMKRGQIQEITSLWINNSIILKADSALIAELMERDDITVLSLDREILLEEPVLVPRKAYPDPAKVTYGVRHIRAEEVWELLGITGSGVTVGILDTGYADHPDLQGKIRAARDFISGNPDNQPNDGKGHGTHCLGTIGGGNTSGRAIGVAPNVNFLVAKIFSDQGATWSSAILRAMQWMADPDHNPSTADHPLIVSNSWGGGMREESMRRLFKDAVQTWRSLGIVPVFAAGNSGPGPYSIHFPGAFPQALAVGATNRKDEIPEFSSRGPIIVDGQRIIKPDISAPGVQVLSAWHKGGYARLNGTSMATPHVAGVIALMLEANPWLGVGAISKVLQETSKDLGTPGKDFQSGAGRIDAYMAVSTVMEFGQIQIHVESGGASSSIRVADGWEVLKTDSHGNAYFSLPVGSYSVWVSSFGFKTEEQILRVKASGVSDLRIKLEPSPQIQLNLKIVNSEGHPLEADVSFLGTPLIPSLALNGKLSLEIPQGDYRILLAHAGYFDREFEVQTSESTDLEFIMLKDAPVVLVDKGGSSRIIETYRRALNDLGVQYNYWGGNSQIGLKEVQGYRTVIWITGDKESATISKLEQEVLESHLHTGGSLILSGQGIGNDLGQTRFYKELLGVRFKGDKRFFKKLRDYRGIKYQLNGKDSAQNQRSPDRLELVDDLTFPFFFYGNGDIAGVSNKVRLGTVVYLGFGLEGVNGRETRLKILERLLKVVGHETPNYKLHDQELRHGSTEPLLSSRMSREEVR
jgi:hypothetical protein